MTGSRVTVCVPVWNAGAFLAETLEALARQTYPHLLIHVSDDGSTDGSASIADAYRADRRFRLTRQPARLGWVAHCTRLLNEVSTEYACIVSHDDLPDPDFVGRLVETLDDHPAVVLAFSDIRVFGLLDKIESQPSVEDATPAERLCRFMATHFDGTAFHGLIRRTAIGLSGGLAPNPCDHFAADVAWLGRVAGAGGLVRVPVPLYAKRRHAASASMQWGRWTPEALAEAWVVHCRELLREALKPCVTAAETGRLVQAAVRRVLAIEPALPFAFIRARPRDQHVQMVMRLLDGLPLHPPCREHGVDRHERVAGT